MNLSVNELEKKLLELGMSNQLLLKENSMLKQRLTQLDNREKESTMKVLRLE